MSSAGSNGLPASDVLLILGSGMGDVFAADELEPLEEFATAVAGHDGVLAACRLAGMSVVVSVGRRHLYEGITVEEAEALVNRAADSGVRTLVVTNAAGGLDPRFRAGDLMAITGVSTLMLGSRNRGQAFGRRDSECGGEPSFAGGIDVDATRYAIHTALERGLRLHAGVYAAVTGPSYETRAEIRMLRRLGAHAVGMSTAPEIAAARRRGMRVVGVSLISNVLSDTRRVWLDHDAVLVEGMRAARRMRVAIECAVSGIHRQTP